MRIKKSMLLEGYFTITDSNIPGGCGEMGKKVVFDSIFFF
jgi:hypothetical protein